MDLSTRPRRDQNINSALMTFGNRLPFAPEPERRPFHRFATEDESGQPALQEAARPVGSRARYNAPIVLLPVRPYDFGSISLPRRMRCEKENAQHRDCTMLRANRLQWCTVQYYPFSGGIMTESITWITPFDVLISVFVTLAPDTFTPFRVSTAMSAP